MVFGQTFSDGLGGEQPTLDTVQNAALKLAHSNGAVVRARTLLAMRGARKLFAVLDRIGRAAATAPHKAGEHMLRRPALMQPCAAVELLASLHGVP